MKSQYRLTGWNYFFFCMLLLLLACVWLHVETSQAGLPRTVRSVKRFMRAMIEEPTLDPISTDAEELVELLSQENTPDRLAVIAQLGQGMTARWSTQAVPALVKILEDSLNQQERVEAAFALVSLSGTARQAIPAMCRCLGDTTGEVRHAAAQFLIRFGKDTQKLLLKALDSSDPLRFSAAAMALSYYQPGLLHPVAPRLQKLTTSSDPMVRLHAAHALGRTDSPESITALHQMLRDIDAHVRSEAIESLGLLSKQSQQTIRTLEPLLNDQEAQVRQVTVRTLSHCGSCQALLPAFQKMIQQEQDEETQRTISRAMDRLRSAP